MDDLDDLSDLGAAGPEKGNMWLLDKIRERVEASDLPEEQDHPDTKSKQLKARSLRLPSNVLTPETVPDFFIPPSLSSIRSLKGCKCRQSHSEKQLATERNDHCFDQTTFAKSEKESDNYKSHEKDIHMLGKFNIPLDESIGHGNPRTQSNVETIDDYIDQVCFSMFALRVLPSYYGALQFRESAHTRRKESLFHMDIMNAMKLRQDILSKQCTDSACWHSLKTSLMSAQRDHVCSQIPTKEEGATCDTQPLTAASQFGSGHLLRALSGLSIFKYFGQGNVCSTVSRSGCKKGNMSSKYIPQKSPNSTENILASCPNILPLRASSFDHLQCQERLQREYMVKLDKRGIVRLSVEYSSDQAALRVRLIATEELYGKSFKPKNVNCTVTVCLIPGKVQRQRSSVIRKSKNPIFNEDFFFDGIQIGDLKMLSLKIKVINKGTNMPFHTVLGGKSLPLSVLLES